MLCKRNDIIAATVHQFPVMGNHKNCFSGFRFCTEHICDNPHIAAIKPAGWLIEDKNTTIRQNAAGDGEPLFLTAGKSGWVCVLVRLQAQLFQQCSGPLKPVRSVV